MFKNTQLCAVILALCVMGQSQASTYSTPVKHSGASHSSSFGSFNSSSKRASIDSVVPSGTSFGSFGSANSSVGIPNNKSSSVLSKNLEQNQAQKNALNNFDARNPTPSATSLLGTLPSATPSINSGTPGFGQPVINQTVIVHERGSSGWGSNWMWFWLGQSSERHSNNTVYVNGVNQPANQAPTAEGVTGSTLDTSTTNKQQPIAQQTGMPWLVIVIWLVIGSAAISLVISHFRHARPNVKARNYSL